MGVGGEPVISNIEDGERKTIYLWPNTSGRRTTIDVVYYGMFLTCDSNRT